MAKRMLIDAAHPEETRVVVLSGNRLDQYDFESSTKKQLKGNIYLAKVTRVEPSLQAAFIEYGGNRHGFLSFNEIHPDYYQIPIADRQALDAQVNDEAADDVVDSVDEPDTESDNGESTESSDNGDATEILEGDDAVEAAGEGDDAFEAAGDGDDVVETVSGDDVEEPPRRNAMPMRRYKIQEVIKRRQILLIQVVKEERGTKGAALTTYLSLAGRYCVLMPNAARGGGISRKIVNPEDRKRLRAIVSDLSVTDGMGVILRTAGLERSRAEIKRDFAYLVKLWSNIRESTLQSSAPALIHEEANLINRSLRDLYASDIDEILVEGEEGYRLAKEFMRMLIPSHARRIKAYRDPIPLFHLNQVGNQLDAMHSPTVHLKSGGYIVISPTEALVSIDVNSGRATRERNIEETATKTNLEAADEIARQLRLRDLSGLIVIDYIDMEQSRNIRNVERRTKDALKGDRARIQIGRISHFGLLEMSRQRLRPSLLEASSLVCAHCGGTGHVRSTESTSLHVLRAIEEEGIQGRSKEITVYVPTAVALYILNQKRAGLTQIEERHGFSVVLASDDSLIPPDYRLERVKGQSDDKESDTETKPDGDQSERGRRRRRGGRGRKDEDSQAQPFAATADSIEPEAAPDSSAETPVRAAAGDGGEDEAPKRRRRGRRGGRRRRRGGEQTAEETTAVEASTDSEAPAETADGEAAAPDSTVPAEAAPEAETAPEAGAAPEAEAAPKPRQRRRKAADTKTSEDSAGDVAEKPKRARRSQRKPAEAETATAEVSETPAAGQTSPDSGNGAEAVSTVESTSIEVDSPAIEAPASEPEAPAAATIASSKATEAESASDEPARRGWWKRLTE